MRSYCGVFQDFKELVKAASRDALPFNFVNNILHERCVIIETSICHTENHQNEYFLRNMRGPRVTIVDNRTLNTLLSPNTRAEVSLRFSPPSPKLTRQEKAEIDGPRNVAPKRPFHHRRVGPISGHVHI